MKKFRIGYIDETGSEIRAFQRWAKPVFEVIPFPPIPNIEELVESLLGAHLNAIVADFNLNYGDPTIHYNGHDVISRVLEKREGFPVFVLTSYEAAALPETDDVNNVYDKNRMNESWNPNDVRHLLNRFKLQIEKYLRKIDEQEARLIELLNIKKQRPLDINEENELIELDSKLEKELDKPSAVPQSLKETTHINKLSSLIGKVDALLQKIEEK
jgi:hypothetical protein